MAPRRRLAWFTVGLVASAMVLTACWPWRSTSQPAPPAPVSAVAREFASGSGDPHPSLPVQWTATTSNAVYTVLHVGAKTSSPGATVPVWVVQLRGTFECGFCKGGGGQRGTAILLVIDQAGIPTPSGGLRWEPGELSFGSKAADLSGVGPVHTFRI